MITISYNNGRPFSVLCQNMIDDYISDITFIMTQSNGE